MTEEKEKWINNEKSKDSYSLWEKLKNGFNPMVECVRWTENYADNIEKVWSKIPISLGKFLATIAIFIIGSSLKGEWLIILMHFMRQLGYIAIGKNESEFNSTESLPLSWENITLERLGLKDLPHFILCASLGSYLIYFSMGGFIHWYFYVRQRDRAHEWKIQPNKWLSTELELHEIMIGTMSLAFTSALTGVVSCYAYNDGSLLTIYYEISDYGWFWFFFQIPVIFIYQDYVTYLLHRTYHLPFLYKHFHKLHHKYKQPTAFSVTAIHPVEILHVQITLLLPIVLFPVHWMPFYGVALYTYYHGIIDHSGVNFKAHWWQPWQPDALFHDNHHQYFHVNFSFNIYIWDILHGTYRRKDRVYNEDIYFGKGKTFTEVTDDVLLTDFEERKSENPLAYRNNENKNKLDKDEMDRKQVLDKIK